MNQGINMDLLIAFMLGRATKGATPLDLLGGVLGACLIGGFMFGMTALIWHFAPQAEHLIQWTGIGDFLSIDDLHVHDAEEGASPIARGFVGAASRMRVCVIAFTIIMTGLFALLFLLKLAAFVVTEIKNEKRKQSRNSR
jgi:hypothetical protein